MTNLDISLVKDHLEKQFSDGLCWENHGKTWLIGHVNYFEYSSVDDENFYKYWNVNNLALYKRGHVPQHHYPNKITIQDVINLVNNFDGTLLTDTYTNSYTEFPVKCFKEHEFKTTYNLLSAGNWCSECAGNNIAKNYLEIAQQIAKERGGRCLSESIKRSHDLSSWECFLLHQWEASYNSVVDDGTWCKQCGTGLYERICRAYMETLFGYKFPSCRPDFMKNLKTGRNLELDGYCRELGIAFEHNGLQHYKEIPGIYFKPVINYDLLKQDMCNKSGVKLIIIPELRKVIKINDLKQFIINECDKLNIKNYNKNANIDINKIYTNYADIIKINEMQKVIESKGGVLLDTIYLGAHEGHGVKCKNNHIWKATPSSIKKGTWCKECYHLSRRKNNL